MKYDWLYKIKYSTHENYLEVYKNRYFNASTYKYDFYVKGFPVFVSLETEILSLITNIQSLDKKLFSLLSQLPGVAVSQFSKKCLIDEVKQTNELEGVANTRKEIKDILESKCDKNNRLSGIVQKYNLLTTSDKIPLKTCQDIRSLYNEFVFTEVQQTDEKDIPDGDIFRKERVYVKDSQTGRVIHEGLYPETTIIQAMSSLLSIIDNAEYNPFINIAVFHYMFGYIHPFYDGNGRMSRFISSYLLSENLEYLVGFRLSYTIKKDISKYYKMFKLTNDPINKGDLTPFTIYFLELIEDSLKELVYYFTDQTEQLYFYYKILKEMQENHDIKDIIDILIQNTIFGEEGLSVDELSKILKKSTPTIRKMLKYLNTKDLLNITQTRPYLYNINLSALQ